MRAMAGCYGNSAEDRYYEKMLDDYLDSLEDRYYEDEDEDEDYLEPDPDDDDERYRRIYGDGY